MKIAIDAGHGGKDPGAVGPTGLQEKDVALDIARCLAAGVGKDVIMIRNDDSFIDVNKRGSIANRAGADLFISIHCNAAENRGAHGIETLVYSAGSKAEEWAIKIHNSVLNAIRKYGITDRGIKYRPNLAVLRGTKMPALLIETSFISNPDEEKLLGSESYRKEIADAILAALGYGSNAQSIYLDIVQTMLDDDVITTPDYWQAVFEGKTSADPAYIKKIVYRYHAKVVR